MMKKTFYAAALCAGIVTLTQVSFAETLQDAVQQMITSNPDIRAVAHNRLARDEEVKQARSGYFPTLDFEAGAGKDYVDKPFDDDLDPWEVKLGLR